MVVAYGGQQNSSTGLRDGMPEARRGIALFLYGNYLDCCDGGGDQSIPFPAQKSMHGQKNIGFVRMATGFFHFVFTWFCFMPEKLRIKSK